MSELNRDIIDKSMETAENCWRFEPDPEKLAKLETRLDVKKECVLCIHFSECSSKAATDEDLNRVPKWPEKCRACLTRNGCDPDRTLFCPPDSACPDYPFNGEEASNG